MKFGLVKGRNRPPTERLSLMHGSHCAGVLLVEAVCGFNNYISRAGYQYRGCLYLFYGSIYIRSGFYLYWCVGTRDPTLFKCERVHESACERMRASAYKQDLEDNKRVTKTHYIRTCTCGWFNETRTREFIQGLSCHCWPQGLVANSDMRI